MNPERPKDPREQMEVRITALLLGEASAFEEAELLEAIKADPALEAYYEEMRRMVKQVEESVQLAPVEATTEQPKLSEKRRGQLTNLFQKPARKTIKLISPTERARRISTLQKIGSIAAAIVILVVVVGTLITPKFAGRTAMFEMEPTDRMIDQLGEAQTPNPIASDLIQRPRLSSVHEPFTNGADPDERFIARYGLAQTRPKVERNAVASSPPPPAAEPARPIDNPGKPTIYLPGQNTPVDNNLLAYSSLSGPPANLVRGTKPHSSQANTYFFDVDKGKEAIALPEQPPAALPALQFAPDRTPSQTVSAGQPIEFAKKVGSTDFETAERPEEVTDFAQKSKAKAANLAPDDSFAKAAEPKPVQRRVSRYAELAAEPTTGIAGRRAEGEERALERVPGVDDKSGATVGLGIGNVGGAGGVANGVADKMSELPQLKVPSGNARQQRDVSLDIQNAKLLREMGKVDEAEAKLRDAAKKEPNNSEIAYNLDQINQDRYAIGSRERQYDSRKRLVDVEKAWVQPTTVSGSTSAGVQAGSTRNDAQTFSRTRRQPAQAEGDMGIAAGTPAANQWDFAANDPFGRADSSSLAEKDAKLDSNLYAKQTSERNLGENFDSRAAAPAPAELQQKLSEPEWTGVLEQPHPAAPENRFVGRSPSLVEKAPVPGNAPAARQMVEGSAKGLETRLNALARDNSAGSNAKLGELASNQSLSISQTAQEPAIQPALGDAPILGRLFRTDKNQETETRKFGEDFKALAGVMEGRAAEARGREQNGVGSGIFAQAGSTPTGQVASGSFGGGSGGFGGVGGGGGGGGGGVAHSRFDELANADGAEIRLALKDKAEAVNGPQEPLPQPNDYARRDPSVSGNVQASKQALQEAVRRDADRLQDRQKIEDKLHNIRLNEVDYEGLPLSEVVQNLSDEAKRRDPSGQGIPVTLISTNSTPTFDTDPATGAPVTLTNQTIKDVRSAIVDIREPVKVVTLGQALDAVVAASDQPIEYSIEDNGIVFRPKTSTNELQTEEVNEPAAMAPPPPEQEPISPTLEPLPEISTKDNAFSTFSLNVSDVSFQLAASSLANGQMPDGARLRSEEFINAFDYHDPMPAPGQRVAFAWDRARNPFAHNRELLRFSVQTAAAGREPGQPLNLVLLLDNSGSMERSDRVHITEEMLRVLAAELTGYDRVSVIAFARTPRLIVDGMPGGNADAFLHRVLGLNPDGGTNLEEAMKLAYATATKHYQANANNRVILITDGAANLGNIDPEQLRVRVIEQRKKGIALDCFGVGWEGYNDNLLEQLSRNGDGRYGFLNDADQAPAQFASQLAGALQVAAADVKAQVEFNPRRVTVYRQIGYQQHQLTKEQFRDNTVDAAEIGAAEAGNALYSVEVNPNGKGPIGTFRVRYRVPSTGQYEEKEWQLDYTADATDLESAPPAMRLASSAAAFAEWLANSPYAQTVTPDALQNLLRGVPEVYAPDPRPTKLQTMIQEARSISGK